MKRTFLSLLALITMGGSMTAGDKPVITVADVEALPGETVSFAVNFVDGKADTYTAMTLYAYFPKEGFTTTGTYTVASSWIGATGVVGDIDTTTGLATIPFASANAITGSEVNNLVTVSFTVDNSVAIGEYPITLEGTMFEYNQSDKDYADDVTFNVKVVDKHSVVLDENSTSYPVAANDVNVTVKRTINANEWSTICLPFDMSEAQVKAAFGDDVQLKDFDGIESTYDGGDNVTAINVKFNEVTAIEANHPYIIKVSTAITSFTTENVNIEVEDEPSVDKDEYITGSGTKKDPYVYHYNSFVGSYVAETDVPDECLFLSENKFWYSTGLTKMKAFRGYFDFYDVLSEIENVSSRVVMKWNDEQPTGISEIKHETQKNSQYYDLSGRRVVRPNKGVYIVDGKKTVIK